MATITLCYSTHRPELLSFAAGIIEQHEVIVLEEPPHQDLPLVLRGDKRIEAHLLELDMDYPAFMLGQYRLLKEQFKKDRLILQIEPYLEHLINVQMFLAEEHRPDEIDPGSTDYEVYCAEKKATGALLDYYRQIQRHDFDGIISSMSLFAKTDAARFILRDTLRARKIAASLQSGKDTYIEAGSIHLLLFYLLGRILSPEWDLKMHSIDREALRALGKDGNLFSPGDHLTLHYIFNSKISAHKERRLCAQALIYSKIIAKNEISPTEECPLPHTKNEIESISQVKKLPIAACRELYELLSPLPTNDAAQAVKDYCQTLGVCP